MFLLKLRRFFWSTFTLTSREERENKNELNSPRIQLNNLTSPCLTYGFSPTVALVDPTMPYCVIKLDQSRLIKKVLIPHQRNSKIPAVPHETKSEGQKGARIEKNPI